MLTMGIVGICLAGLPFSSFPSVPAKIIMIFITVATLETTLDSSDFSIASSDIMRIFGNTDKRENWKMPKRQFD